MKREKPNLTLETGFAVETANHISENLFHCHRGALRCRFGQETANIVFGNDGYSGNEDCRARKEVEALRKHLETEGIAELGFGVDSNNGCTWVMLVDSNDLKRLESLVWDSWRTACGIEDNDGGFFAYCSVQRQIASDKPVELKIQNSCEGDPQMQNCNERLINNCEHGETNEK